MAHRQIARSGTLVLDAVYKDGSGNLVDPGAPRVSITDAADVVVVTNAVPVRDSLGVYHYDYAVAADAPLGLWVARWTGTIAGASVSGEETFEVVAAGVVGPPVVSVSRYRTITLDTASTDAAVTGALVDAEELVADYLRRPVSQVTRTETLRIYPGSRVYPSATPVTSVATAGLVIQGSSLRNVSPDVQPGGILLGGDSRDPMGYATATVTYTGGWTASTVPASIERAIAWQAHALLHDPGNLASVPAGATRVALGDASVSFEDGALPRSLTTTARADLAPWRRR